MLREEHHVDEDGWPAEVILPRRVFFRCLLRVTDRFAPPFTSSMQRALLVVLVLLGIAARDARAEASDVSWILAGAVGVSGEPRDCRGGARPWMQVRGGRAEGRFALSAFGSLATYASSGDYCNVYGGHSRRLLVNGGLRGEVAAGAASFGIAAGAARVYRLWCVLDCRRFEDGGLLELSFAVVAVRVDRFRLRPAFHMTLGALGSYATLLLEIEWR